MPTLVIKWDDDDISESDYKECLLETGPYSASWTSLRQRCHLQQSFGLALEPAVEGEATGRFVLRNSSSLKEQYPEFVNNTIVATNLTSSRQFWLHCIDTNNILKPSQPVRGVLSPGIPVAVRVFSQSVLSPSNSDNYEQVPTSDETDSGREELFKVPFTSKSKLTDLKIILVDSCANVVNLKKLSDRVKDVAVQVLCLSTFLPFLFASSKLWCYFLCVCSFRLNSTHPS